MRTCSAIRRTVFVIGTVMLGLWLCEGTASAAQKKKRAAVPAADKPFVQDGLTFAPVPVGAKEMPPCVCWAVDGKSFFCLEASEARLCKFSVEPLKQVAELDLNARASWLSVFQDGIVVTFGDQTEIWLIDPETLEVRLKADVPSATKVYSSPALMVGFAVLHGQGRDGLGMINLKSGKLQRVFTSDELRVPEKHLSPSWGRIAVAPDGKAVWVVTQGHIERFRFNPRKKQLQYEDSSPSVGQDGKELTLSPDGSLICWPCGSGNSQRLTKHPEVPPYTTFVYSTNDLSQPKLVLRTGAYPQAVGLDSVTGLAFGQNFDTTLLIYNLNGLELKAIRLKGHGTYQLAPSPTGGKLLMLTGESLFLVDTSPLTQPAGDAAKDKPKKKK